jgi:transposase-like protein
VYRELRAREATRQLPVVIVTGTDAERADFPFFLRKPIHADTLSYAVENAIRETSRQPAATGSNCPACQGTNTCKTAEARRTEIHFCSTCRKTFTIDKAPRQ